MPEQSDNPNRPDDGGGHPTPPRPARPPRPGDAASQPAGAGNLSRENVDRASQQDANRLAREVQAARAELQRTREELIRERDNLRQVREQLAGQRLALQAQSDQLDNQGQTLAIERAQLAEIREEFQREKTHLETEYRRLRARLEGDLGQRQKTLRATVDDLLRQRDELTEQTEQRLAELKRMEKDALAGFESEARRRRKELDEEFRHKRREADAERKRREAEAADEIKQRKAKASDDIEARREKAEQDIANRQAKADGEIQARQAKAEQEIAARRARSENAAKQLRETVEEEIRKRQEKADREIQDKHAGAFERIEKQQSELESWQQRLTGQEREHAERVARELGEVEARRAAVAAKLESDREQFEAWRRQTEGRLERERNEFNARTAEVQRRIERLDEDSERLAVESADVAEKLRAQQAQAADLAEREQAVAASDKDARALLKDLRRREEQLEKQQQKLADEDRDLHLRQKEVAARLKSDREQFEAWRKQTEDRLEQERADFNARTAEVQRRMERLDEDSERLAVESADVAEKQRAQQAQAAELAEREEAVTASDKDARALLKDLRRREGQLEKQQKKLADQDHDLRVREKELAEGQDAVRAEQSALRDQQKQMQKQQRDQEKEIARRQSEMDKREKDLSRRDEKMRQAEQKSAEKVEREQRELAERIAAAEAKSSEAIARAEAESTAKREAAESELAEKVESTESALAEKVASIEADLARQVSETEQETARQREELATAWESYQIDARQLKREQDAFSGQKQEVEELAAQARADLDEINRKEGAVLTGWEEVRRAKEAIRKTEERLAVRARAQMEGKPVEEVEREVVRVERVREGPAIGPAARRWIAGVAAAAAVLLVIVEVTIYSAVGPRYQSVGWMRMEVDDAENRAPADVGLQELRSFVSQEKANAGVHRTETGLAGRGWKIEQADGGRQRTGAVTYRVWATAGTQADSVRTVNELMRDYRLWRERQLASIDVTAGTPDLARMRRDVDRELADLERRRTKLHHDAAKLFGLPSPPVDANALLQVMNARVRADTLQLADLEREFADVQRRRAAFQGEREVVLAEIEQLEQSGYSFEPEMAKAVALQVEAAEMDLDRTIREFQAATMSAGKEVETAKKRWQRAVAALAEALGRPDAAAGDPAVVAARNEFQLSHAAFDRALARATPANGAYLLTLIQKIADMREGLGRDRLALVVIEGVLQRRMAAARLGRDVAKLVSAEAELRRRLKAAERGAIAREAARDAYDAVNKDLNAVVQRKLDLAGQVGRAQGLTTARIAVSIERADGARTAVIHRRNAWMMFAAGAVLLAAAIIAVAGLYLLARLPAGRSPDAEPAPDIEDIEIPALGETAVAAETSTE